MAFVFVHEKDILFPRFNIASAFTGVWESSGKQEFNEQVFIWKVTIKQEQSIN